MFHKALWMRNYKQGKVVIFLLWAVSIYNLPIAYLNRANAITQELKEWYWEEWTRYTYHFNYSLLVILGGLFILLACLLIGSERSNQGMDTVFGMPFERKNIYLSKWLIGAVNITAITLVNMILMYIVQKTTIHGEHQTFTPFLYFFLLMFISLLTVYSVALFVGTITGELFSQALLTIIICYLPAGIHGLITNAIGWHVDMVRAPGFYDNQLYWKISNFFSDITLVSAATPGFWYDQMDGYGKLLDVAKFTDMPPSLTMYIAALMYLLIFFPAGLFLFKRTPNENNGKIILYKKLEPVFLWSAVICFALIGGDVGGSLLWSKPLLGYYAGLMIVGFLCYKILSRLMKKPWKLK